MKASRTWLVWAALAVCAATIIGAMTWQTRNAIASERERAAAEKRADLQEKMRLALWRMDTLGATLIIEDDDGGEAADFVKGRFEWKETGQITQPGGAPAAADLQRALVRPGTDFDGCYIAVDSGSFKWRASPAPVAPIEEAGNNAVRELEEKQQTANVAEQEKRSQAIDNIFSKQRAIKEAPGTLPAAPKRKAESLPPADAVADIPPPQAAPAEEPFSPGAITSSTRPVWIGDELFLMRAISGQVRTIAGSWIDSGVLRARLLAEADDLLPAAKLLPAKSRSADGLVLASFPFRLDPGPPPAYSGSLGAPIRLSLIAGWSASVIAILAASLLVLGIMRLSERRASFVSAVTHELRTPLTTFRLYSDMLESDAVRPEKRGDYLRVLSREADRLSHLVENVLAFSRIERGSARSAVNRMKAADLLSPMRDRFESRLAPAGLALAMPLDEPAAAETLRADAAAIEHILFNLIDNAAKYAASGQPPEVRISVEKSPTALEIRVTDHGPGIPPSEQRRIFRAFHKSAREAAETRPGVGLGLALSRRLARGMGGDLTCVSSEGDGATFVLSLPA